MVNGTDVGELVPQEVYSRGGGYCDGGGDIRFMQATAKTAMRRALGIRLRGGQGETVTRDAMVRQKIKGEVYAY